MADLLVTDFRSLDMMKNIIVRIVIEFVLRPELMDLVQRIFDSM